MNQKLEEKIPPKLQGTLDAAFAKAFALILRKEPELLKDVSTGEVGAGLSGTTVYGGCKAGFQIPASLF